MVALSFRKTWLLILSEVKYSPKRLTSKISIGDNEKVVKNAVDDDKMSGSVLLSRLNELRKIPKNVLIF